MTINNIIVAFCSVQVADYSTRRLPGLDILPVDAAVMVKAKAHKTRSCGISDDPGGASQEQGRGVNPNCTMNGHSTQSEQMIAGRVIAAAMTPL